jgi:hypothetical protein
MLEKLNSIEYNENERTVLKCVTSSLEARSEKTCLAALAQISSGEGTKGFNVPKVFAEESTEYAVCMEYVPGIRAYDLMALLNHVIRICPDKHVVSRALAIKIDLIDAAIRMIKHFQGDQIQSTLRQVGLPITSYDFKGKLTEACNYLQLWSQIPSTDTLVEEVDHIASFLSQRVSVTFRDATLKNFLIKLPPATGVARDYRDLARAVGDYLRPTNWQWTDTGSVLAILDFLSSSETLMDCMYSIDFESVHSLTTKQDDFIHLLTLEVAGISYTATHKFLQTHLRMGEEELNYAILLRCLRDGTRRLFYKCERPAIFATRYYHETVEHLLLVALEALNGLRQNSSQPEFLAGIHSLLVQFKTTHKPWPWQLGVTQMDRPLGRIMKGT